MNTIMQTVKEIEEAICHGDHTYTGSYGMQQYRTFMNAVGYAPGEYLRRRRLSIALSRLRVSQMTDIEIAYACGYSSQQAMCRDIKKMLGITTGDYRKSDELYYFPPYTGTKVHPLTVSQQTVPSLTALDFESDRLRGIESQAISAFFDQNPQYQGRLFGRDGGQSGNRFRYTLLVQSELSVKIDGFTMGAVYPSYAAMMAVAACPNDEIQIGETWDWLYNDWLPRSCFQYAGETHAAYETAYFEEYLYKSRRPYRLKLYLPVIRAGGFIKLQLDKLDCRILACAAAGADAQNRAGQLLVSYVREYHPYLLMKAHRLYMCETDTESICGIFCDETVWEIHNPFRLMEYRQCDCIRMEIFGLCNPQRIRDILTDWAAGNGFEPVQSKPLFFIYHIDDPLTEVYLPVKKF